MTREQAQALRGFGLHYADDLAASFAAAILADNALSIQEVSDAAK